MDTNLLDTCREARCEFEGASAAAAACVEENCCEKVKLFVKALPYGLLMVHFFDDDFKDFIVGVVMIP